MTAIRVIFPWGRYYAHPWGLNPVRLREAEWPPSPWRLLRALVSCWFRSHPAEDFGDDAKLLIESLGRELPCIGIGKVTFGQTVHYQPNYGATDKAEREDARYKNTRHENHFAAIEGPVIFRWHALSDLPVAQDGILREMLQNMSYFGRAESICQADPVSDADIAAIDGIGWCVPTKGRRISERTRDVFCPDPSDFVITDLWARRAEATKAEPGCTPKHLVDTLLSTVMKPDGAKWVSYEMPVDWPEKRVVRTARLVRRKPELVPHSPRVARYLCFSLQCRVPIPPRFTVPLAEQFRHQASRQFVRLFGAERSSFALFGHAVDRPLDVGGEHQHAFYLPTQTLKPKSGEELGFITELHVWCPYGLTTAETQVLSGVQRLTWKDGRYPVRPVLTSMSMEPPADLPLATGRLASKTWRTLTPFVPPRHYRRNGPKLKFRESESPENQLIRYLRMEGVRASGEVHRLGLAGVRPEPVSGLPPMPLWSIVRAPDDQESGPAHVVLSPVHVPANDPAAKDHRQRVGFFLEVAFDVETTLPMPAWGHSNHFGLGLMVPAIGRAPIVLP